MPAGDHRPGPADIGEAEVTIPAVVEGDDAEIAFNLGYQQSYLRGKDYVVTLSTVPGEAEQIRSSVCMVVFTQWGAPMVIMMPMLVRPEGETEPPPEAQTPTAADDEDTGKETVEAATEDKKPAEPDPEAEQAPPRRTRRRKTD